MAKIGGGLYAVYKLMLTSMETIHKKIIWLFMVLQFTLFYPH